MAVGIYNRAACHCTRGMPRPTIAQTRSLLIELPKSGMITLARSASHFG